MSFSGTAATPTNSQHPRASFIGTYNKVLPYVLMGSLTVASSVVNLFLPETLNKDLPETVEQMQQCQR